MGCAAERSDGPTERDDGFTLVELLVVMIIVAMLAAIAIPIIANQRSKAEDAGTRSDARQLGMAVRMWFDEHPGAAAPTLEVVDDRYQLAGTDASAVSDGVRAWGADPATVDTTGWTASAWCLALTNPRGNVGTVKFSAQRGLATGPCSSPTAP